MSRYLTTLFCVLLFVATSAWGQSAETKETRIEKHDENRGLLVDAFDGKSKESDREPVYISSERFELEGKKREFHYEGGVEVRQADLLISADRVRGTYSEKNELQKVFCEGNVVITEGTRMRASSNRAVYDVPTSIITLTEGPEIIENGNALAADTIRVFLDEDRSEAEGRVRVKLLKQEEQGASQGLKGFELN